ncbi:MAG: alpha/beta hydrolase [Saprospiraceae bacterium]|nr:alpha/beta hydrolase [Lewinella sp.]
MKILSYIFLFLLVIAIIIYLLPVNKQTFDQLYQGDASIKKSLAEFRKIPTKELQIDDTDWTYLNTGNGPNTLLFLHGMGGAYDIWWQQIEALKADFRIISITLPEVHSLAEAVHGLEAILDREGIDKVTIIGTSMGGYIAQYFLQQHPQRLNKLVLGNTFPPNDILKAKNEGLRKKIPYIPEWIIMREFRNNVSEVVVPASENSELVEAYLHEQYSGYMSKSQFIGRMDVVLDHFQPNFSIAQIGIPKLIIESDNDPLITPELRKALRELYPEAYVYTFHDKGHFSYLNASEEYTDTLRAFLLQ